MEKIIQIENTDIQYRIEIDPDDEYILFNTEVSGKDVIQYDFSHLNRTDAIVLVKLLSRNNTIPYRYHPDVVDSLREEKENSPYYKKTPYEIEIIHRKESTRDISKDKEKRAMMAPVNESDQIIRNKKYKTINSLVAQGYDRAYCMDSLQEYIKEHGNGLLNLTVKRVSEIMDAYLQKQVN